MRQSPKQKIVLYAGQCSLQNDYRESIVSAQLEENNEPNHLDHLSAESFKYIPIKMFR